MDVEASDRTEPSARPRFDGIVVRGAGAEALAARQLGADWTLTRLGPGLDGVLARAPGGTTWSEGFDALNRTRRAAGDGIEYIEPAVFSAPRWPTPSPTPATPTRAQRWPLEQIEAERAWDLPPRPGGRARGEGVLIAHPDTGYTLHPELCGGPDGDRVRRALGYDFLGEKADAADEDTGLHPGHGTTTSSVMIGDGARGRDGYERVVRGSAPRASTIPYRVTDTVMLRSTAALSRAIFAAIEAGAGVVSISLGTPLGSRLLFEALDAAERAGVIVVAAAGQVWPWVPFPGRFDPVVTVTATDRDGRVWPRAANGWSIDVSAPGVGLQVAVPDLAAGTYTVRESQGTSYSTAFTAGAAACWLAHWSPEWLHARFGAAVPAVFRHVLRCHGTRARTWWVPWVGGQGVLDMHGLLAFDLTGLSIETVEAEARAAAREAARVLPPPPFVPPGQAAPRPIDLSRLPLEPPAGHLLPTLLPTPVARLIERLVPDAARREQALIYAAASPLSLGAEPAEVVGAVLDAIAR